MKNKPSRPPGRPRAHPRERKHTLPLRVPIPVARVLVRELTAWAARTDTPPRTWKLREEVEAVEASNGDVMVQIPLALPRALRDQADKQITRRVKSVGRLVSTKQMNQAIRAGFHREMIELGAQIAARAQKRWREICDDLFASSPIPNTSEIAARLYELGLERELEKQSRAE